MKLSRFKTYAFNTKQLELLKTMSKLTDLFDASSIWYMEYMIDQRHCANNIERETLAAYRKRYIEYIKTTIE